MQQQTQHPQQALHGYSNQPHYELLEGVAKRADSADSAVARSFCLPSILQTKYFYFTIVVTPPPPPPPPTPTQDLIRSRWQTTTTAEISYTERESTSRAFSRIRQKSLLLKKIVHEKKIITTLDTGARTFGLHQAGGGATSYNDKRTEQNQFYRAALLCSVDLRCRGKDGCLRAHLNASTIRPPR